MEYMAVSEKQNRNYVFYLKPFCSCITKQATSQNVTLQVLTSASITNIN